MPGVCSKHCLLRLFLFLHKNFEIVLQMNTVCVRLYPSRVVPSEELPDIVAGFISRSIVPSEEFPNSVEKEYSLCQASFLVSEDFQIVLQINTESLSGIISR